MYEKWPDFYQPWIGWDAVPEASEFSFVSYHLTIWLTFKNFSMEIRTRNLQELNINSLRGNLYRKRRGEVKTRPK